MSFYKIYNDGSHYIGLRQSNALKEKIKRGKRPKSTELDLRFDELCQETINKKLKRSKQFNYIVDALHIDYGSEITQHDETITLGEYVKSKLNKKFNTTRAKTERMRRKLYLHKWNYFVTFTYDDKKCTELDFEKKLKTKLSNLQSRRKWKYMGAWERGGKSNRLHLHCVLYVPDGQMVGEVVEIEEYNQGIKEKHFKNTEFLELFGRNEFSPICNILLKMGYIEKYLLKYIAKSNGKLLYSRNTPTDVICELDDEEDICLSYEAKIPNLHKTITKHILFDDVIDPSIDIHKQATDIKLHAKKWRIS